MFQILEDLSPAHRSTVIIQVCTTANLIDVIHSLVQILLGRAIEIAFCQLQQNLSITDSTLIDARHRWITFLFCRIPILILQNPGSIPSVFLKFLAEWLQIISTSRIIPGCRYSCTIVVIAILVQFLFEDIHHLLARSSLIPAGSLRSRIFLRTGIGLCGVVVLTISPQVGTTQIVNQKFKNAFCIVLMRIVEIPGKIIYQLVGIWRLGQRLQHINDLIVFLLIKINFTQCSQGCSLGRFSYNLIFQRKQIGSFGQILYRLSPYFFL